MISLSLDQLLLKAIQKGYNNGVHLALIKGADANLCNEFGWPILTLAVKYGEKKIVQMLIDAGAHINTTNSNGETALMWAALCNHEDLVQLLLDAGADINIADKDGWTALVWGAEMGYGEIVQDLISAGSNVNIVVREKRSEGEQQTPLHLAGSLEVVQTLIDSGANMEAKNKKGETPSEYHRKYFVYSGKVMADYIDGCLAKQKAKRREQGITLTSFF